METEKIRVIVITFVYLERKQILSNKSNQLYRQSALFIIRTDTTVSIEILRSVYSTDSLTYDIPCSGQRGQKPYPVLRYIPL